MPASFPPTSHFECVNFAKGYADADLLRLERYCVRLHAEDADDYDKQADARERSEHNQDELKFREVPPSPPIGAAGRA
jgi:hypothetical protein